eukprot:gb/GFBE01054764.1/.p3 GENE.gb/GFBE01054764.1/~~gb/GFBE01054764.1/.p3  ORF type:complete len:152 (+),score=10.37 gb/GFBE01054764.1/:269-724(+)
MPPEAALPAVFLELLGTTLLWRKMRSFTGRSPAPWTQALSCARCHGGRLTARACHNPRAICAAQKRLRGLSCMNIDGLTRLTLVSCNPLRRRLNNVILSALLPDDTRLHPQLPLHRSSMEYNLASPFPSRVVPETQKVSLTAAKLGRQAIS